MTAEFSVGLRFLIASVVVEGYRRLFDSEKVKLTLSDIQLIVLQGVFLYSLNIWLCYYSSFYIVSGLIAVTVSTMIIPNLIFGKIFLGIPLRYQTVAGAFLGILGVFILFIQEVFTLPDGLNLLTGFLLAFSSTFFSVIGTQVSGKLAKRGIPILFSISRALLIGAFLSIGVSLLKDGIPLFPHAVPFWTSLLYLGIISSAASYTLYGYLIKKYGPGVASYLWIASPAISLALSTFCEGYGWTVFSSIGIILIIIGGILTGLQLSLWTALRGKEWVRFFSKKAFP